MRYEYNLERLNSFTDDLTSGDNVAFRSYLLGSLAEMVNADEWDRALDIAADCLRQEHERKAAR